MDPSKLIEGMLNSNGIASEAGLEYADQILALIREPLAKAFDQVAEQVFVGIIEGQRAAAKDLEQGSSAN